MAIGHSGGWLGAIFGLVRGGSPAPRSGIACSRSSTAHRPTADGGPGSGPARAARLPHAQLRRPDAARAPRRPHCLRVASPRWATEILASAGCFIWTEVIACLGTDMEVVEDCCEPVADALDAERSIAFRPRDRRSPAHKSGSSTVSRVPAAGSDSKPNAPSWDALTDPNESEAVTGDLRSRETAAVVFDAYNDRPFPTRISSRRRKATK